MTSPLRALLGSRLLIIDGAMGTMLQNVDLTMDDFAGLEGCNEILNVTRPDVVSGIHEAYLEAGADLIETNTFGVNLAALGEYDIADRITELAAAGTRLARTAADQVSTPERPRFVLGSLGPGTKLPTLGQIGFADIRDAYQLAVEAMIDEGVDAVQLETCQDLLQAKAAVIAAHRAAAARGVDLPVLVDITVETTGTMLMGSETGAALTVLESLGIDAIGMNCATGPAEMAEHLRTLSRGASVPVMCMPNAGLPEITGQGARYPLGPADITGALSDYAERFGLSVVGGCCGTTPEHIAVLADALAGRPVAGREVHHVDAVASLYNEVPLSQDTAYLSIGERTNANGSKAFREAMLAENWDECLDIAKAQTRDGAHLLDLCVDYVGRDGAADMAELSSRMATAVTLPIVLDSTEPQVLRTGLEHLAGRCIINSVNYEDGDGPDSRFARVMPLVREHGAGVVALTIDEEGQARTREWKVRVASRLIDDLTGNWGMDVGDILVDCLTFPIATGQEETRRDGIETIEAIRELKKRYPGVRTTLGVSNISFGLNPAARIVLNSVFLHEAVAAGLDSAIVHAAKIVPIDRIPDEQREVALDLVHDRRGTDAPAPRGAENYDPLTRFLELFEGVTAASMKAEREAELAAMPLLERLKQRIIDGNAKGLTEDLDEALRQKPALDIVNEDLLAGMQVVGDLFGSGRMQLPFVLQSAEVMKTAVAHLEPHMEKTDAAGKGTLVLATVKGDVHDIGKNLVDIIVSNNGYSVVNLGIKQPVQAIIEAAEGHHADAIGMSGLLVKSTMVMRDNLLELNDKGLASRYPVMLGGAALTRSFVEHDLNDLFEGDVRYAKDAFEGLRLMDAVMAVKHGVPGAALPAIKPRRVRASARPAGPDEAPDAPDVRSDVARPTPDGGVDVPAPPFWGSRVTRGIPLADITEWLDERATYVGRWGLKGSRSDGSYDRMVADVARPRLRMLLDRIRSENLGRFAVVHGYWPVISQGRELLVLDPDDTSRELTRFEFPRQTGGRRLCVADFFRDAAEAAELGPDVIAFQMVTMGDAVSAATQELFEADAYREYLELHGLSVQLTEALAEMWHHRVRTELGIAEDHEDVAEAIDHQAYRGSRYSFGYAACPNLEDRAKVAALLDPSRIGVELSEEYQLHPEQSTDAFVLHHPEAKYFNAK
ncbi:Methionine synthase (5-methyltetrahydrofolate:L-homocysteine S-methyltransferase) [Acidipropionibacterium acidipropionici ATCC 4875]|uniref:Methionine synthase n=1 Tax=Acidipropionibacterium acidipropionici (strain ATCC 4875 / DSM 20272 / JCM 6432 / NBRC 12425 / NCIMB 8070 / 4) TaxID=1171373 RepID=K7RX62_ACIA4|nr:methionine synthase [Acidipropionibacterium acidipropionici]AFV89558.1 Methionine synthase (5-methyltetrahydrofolate:L-homocysteine S-methyltransferase) [Acidipropionibacterium acidipropionici ATCC 4875]